MSHRSKEIAFRQIDMLCEIARRSDATENERAFCRREILSMLEVVRAPCTCYTEVILNPDTGETICVDCASVIA